MCGTTHGGRPGGQGVMGRVGGASGPLGACVVACCRCCVASATLTPVCCCLCVLLCYTHSQNLDDCLSKLQAMVDAAVEAVTPKEIDPETVKRVKAA